MIDADDIWQYAQKMNICDNPNVDFEHANVDQLLAALKAPVTHSEMWTGRLHSMLGAVIPALVELRDVGYLVLNKGSVYEYLDLAHVIGLSQNPLLRDETRTRLNAYLTSLPNFSQEGQSTETEMHHGYLTMQVAAILK